VRQIKQNLLFLIGILSFFVNSCNTPLHAENQETIQLVTLEGVVICKPAAKNLETWTAGGGEYCVLDVGDAEIEQKTAEEGVILQPSSQVEKAQFFDHEGKRVQITGEYIEGQPYVPQSPLESYPTDMKGNPLPVGAGFQVQTITVLKRI
jgi:hypothetical protein